MKQEESFLFCKILEKNRELCRQLLEAILGITIRKPEPVDREKELGAFLKYLRGEKVSDSSFIEATDREAASARDCEEWRVEYMTLMMEYREKYKEGEAAGIEKGIEKGEQRINELNRRLHEDGRLQDMLLSFDNPEYQKALLKEYGI